MKYVEVQPMSGSADDQLPAKARNGWVVPPMVLAMMIENSTFHYPGEQRHAKKEGEGERGRCVRGCLLAHVPARTHASGRIVAGACTPSRTRTTARGTQQHAIPPLPRTHPRKCASARAHTHTHTHTHKLPRNHTPTHPHTHTPTRAHHVHIHAHAPTCRSVELHTRR